MPAITVRPLEPSDRAAWELLWQGYLDFYRASVPREVWDVTWSRFFDLAEPVHALVAEREGRVVGLVHYLFHRNTWMREPVCYLQDLFTDPDARSRGVGRALIEAVYAAAQEAGSSRVYWMTQEDNATARALYDRIASYSGFVQYRKALP